MSLKKVEQVKKDRFFRIWDILIYVIVVAVVVVLFITTAVTTDRSTLSAVSAYYNNDLVFAYDFEKDELEIKLAENAKIRHEDGASLTIVFCEDGGNLEDPKDYNLILINKSERSVSVTESDCSYRKDCVHTPALTSNAAIIVCSPHMLKIVPDNYVDDGEHLPVG